MIGSTVACTIMVEINVLGKALAGSPAELAAALHGLAQAGIAHVQLVLPPLYMAAVEAFASLLEILDGG